MELLIGAIVFVFILYKIISRNSKPKMKITTTVTSSPLDEKIITESPKIKNNISSSSITDSSTTPPSINDIDDNDFATFTIHTSYEKEPENTSNKQKGRWIRENEHLTINKRQFNKGLFYFGGVMKSLDGYGTEPSLVDEKLPASNAIDEDHTEIYTDASLGYWPSYVTLTERCRGAYLDWLASERNNPDTPIGYVFIYFYGLERRIIENKTNENVSDQEFMSIFDEVLRLNKIFSNNRSFKAYSANLLELIILLRPSALEHRMEEIPEKSNALSFKIKLAKTVSSGQRVGGDLAFEWLKNTLEYSLKMPARRCSEEFKMLFQIRYTEKFPEDLLVKPNKTKLRLSYHAASNGIHGVDLSLEDLPDPSILKGPINKLIPIADQCTEELAGYSRYLGKAGTSRSDIAALMLLPHEIANESNSPVIESFKKWADQVIQNQEGLTTVKEFWSHTGMPFPKALNKKENELLTNLATKANIGIAPDPRFHQEKVKVDGNIVLFTPNPGEFFEPSQVFNQVSLAMRLGAMVATIDGHVDQDEKLALQRLIDHDDKLAPSEKNSLKAYLTWRLNSPANMAGLKARIGQLKAHEIESLKTFMISIALADGKVDSSEIKQIEKLYTSLGLDKSLVTSDIHHFTSTKKTSSNSTSDIGINTNTFEFNEEILAMYENDTSDAKSMLENIFVSIDETEVEILDTVQTENDGLDNAHTALFNALLGKEVWPRNEVHELCQKLSLMVDGAIETINDWAYEKVDAPVLDDDGDIYVDLEIVEELKG
jgi:tellurite resistance protein